MNRKEIPVSGYEKVVEIELIPGVKSIIAIHNTHLGPSLGGCRFYPYHSFEDALTDVLRLSEGMSYKSALAGLPLGGGKAVIAADPQKVKSKELLEIFGDFVNSLEGKYITAKDVGVEVADLDTIATRTEHVRGTGAAGSSGNPSPLTAYGVYQGIKAAAKFRWQDSSLKGKRIIIQGLGHVGFETAKYLSLEGSIIYASEMNQALLKNAVKELDLQPLAINDWQNQSADIFCPCAMGAILNKQTIPQLAENGIEIVAGGANNQLLNVTKDAERLKEAYILYAPDYVINAGGVINIACEIGGYDPEKARNMTSHIYDTLLEIFARSQKADLPTATVSLQIAKERLGLA